jgi:hypothetical protein
VTRRYGPGTPYRKHREEGNRELLLARAQAGTLADQIARIAAAEGPIHRELLGERLKEINGVARAGANVQTNIDRAVNLALGRGRVQALGPAFLVPPGRPLESFRCHGDGVERPPVWIPREEIALAVLHIVEDQYGCRREALPRIVGGLFGFDRAPAGLTEAVGNVVDDLLERGVLTAGGPHVHLA